MQQSFFIKYKLNHLLIWLLVFGAWFFLRYDGFALPATAFKVTLVKVIDLAAMVYITNYLLIPKLLYKKKYLLFGIAFIGLIAASSLLKMNVLGRIMNNPGLLSFAGNWKARIYDNVIPHFFLVLAGVAFKLMFDFTEAQKKMAEMAKENAEAELSFLKAQINPHFLFNSLNSVYFLIDKENAEAREALHRFSEMLRYQLYEAGGKKIPIEKEIGFLQDYVHLQKLRKDEGYKVELNTANEVKGFSIEPLLLLSFVENAFKHISHRTDKENFVRININRNNGQLLFDISNSKEDMSNHETGGIGLQNVKRRLELLYPNNYELKIENKKDVFTVDLKLNL
jgi:signal transduction histidine kinase